MDGLIFQEHNALDQGEMELLNDICTIVDSARSSVAKHANSEIILMNWNIGERINREILGNMRAEYGKQIVSRLATQLRETYGGSNFNVRNLRRMMQFAAEFQDTEIVSRLATQLSWSHFVEVLPLKGDFAAGVLSYDCCQ